MKKIIGTVLLVAIAYTSFWSYEGNKGKSFIERKLNEAQIQSDKITLSGYPFFYVVSVENPKWINENVNVISKGTLSLTSNFFGDKFWVARDGEVHLKVDNSNQLNSLSIKGKSEFFVESRDSLFINHIFKELPVEFTEDSLTVIFEKLKAASIAGNNLIVELENSSETMIFDFGNLNLNWEKDKNDKTQTHRLKIFTENAKIQKKHTEFSLVALEDAFSNAFIPDQSQFIFEGDLTIPNEPFSLLTIPEMSININRCDNMSSNANSKSKMSFIVKKNNSDQEEIHFNFLSDGTVAEAGYKDQVKKFLAELKEIASHDGEDSEIVKDLLAKHEEEIIKIIPKFYTLSPMGLNIDIGTSVKHNGIQLEKVDLNIKDLNLTMKPYGFLSKGHFEAGMNNIEGAYKIQMSHYKNMIQDLVSYVNNFVKILSNVYESPEYEITQKHVDEMLQLLRKVSDDPNVDMEDLHLTIKATKEGTFSIGSLNATEALDSFEKIFNKPEEKAAPTPAQK